MALPLLFCCWLSLVGRRPLHKGLSVASMLISTIHNSSSALLISETHAMWRVQRSRLCVRRPGEWVHVFGNIRTGGSYQV